MKQFWTPLASLLGLLKSSIENEPARDSPPDNYASEPRLNPHWQLIRDALEMYAVEELLPRSIRHAAIVSDEVYIVTRLHLQATNQAAAEQLEQWFHETDSQHLIQWVRATAWNTPEIRQWIDTSQVEKLTVAPPAIASRDESILNPYMGKVTAESFSSRTGLDVRTEGHWGKASTALSIPSNILPIHITIDEEGGSRVISLQHPLVIVGKQKTIQLADGQQIDLKNGQPFPWQGKAALFIAAEGTHVSALHLAIQSNEYGVQVRDLASTNGTYISGQRMSAHQLQDVNANLILHLGGLPHDRLYDTPRLHLRVQFASASTTNNVTPLRSEVTPLRSAILAQLKIIRPNGNLVTVPITRQPFLIGRSSNCDFQVPVDHVMVSREHLRIDAIDLEHSRFLVVDLSRQALTLFNGTPSSARDHPQWIPIGTTVEIGHRPNYPGFLFQLVPD